MTDSAAARSSLLQHLRETEAEQIALLRAFLQAPSANPPGDTRPAAAVLERFLADRRLAPSIHAARAGIWCSTGTWTSSRRTTRTAGRATTATAGSTAGVLPT
jgi:hypothetical protein